MSKWVNVSLRHVAFIISHTLLIQAAVLTRTTVAVVQTKTDMTGSQSTRGELCGKMQRSSTMEMEKAKNVEVVINQNNE